VLHEYVVAPPPVRVAEAPLHAVGELTVVTGTGFTVTVVVAVAEQPPVNVQVTVYVPVMATVEEGIVGF
jgi:hypothetical protein